MHADCASASTVSACLELDSVNAHHAIYGNCTVNSDEVLLLECRGSDAIIDRLEEIILGGPNTCCCRRSLLLFRNSFSCPDP